jgi:signal transduction histidine kinase
VPGIAALIWRRRRPRTVWAVTTGVAALLLTLRSGHDWGGLSPLLIMAAPLVALATVVHRAPRRRGLVGLGVTLGALEGALLPGTHRAETFVLAAVLVVAAWALGDGARHRRAYALAIAERAAADERARTARELHDIVAHHISMVALQAGTARMLAEAGHAPEPELLAGLESASRQAMDELRQTLGVQPDSPDQAVPRPGLDRLPVLIDRLAPTGLSVRVAGLPGRLPAGIDLAAYRVVQEGLTNVLRHSSSRIARVELRRSPDALTVSVLDDGPSKAPPPVPGHTGHGLTGLRERAATHGGWLRAGPRPGGGFELRAHLPLEPPEPLETAEMINPVDAAS